MFVSCRLYDNRHHRSDLPLLLAFCSSHSRTATGNFFACLSCLCLNNLEISNLSQPNMKSIILYIHVQTQHQKLFQNHLENHLLVVVVLVVVAVVLVVVAVAVVVDGGGG